MGLFLYFLLIVFVTFSCFFPFIDFHRHSVAQIFYWGRHRKNEHFCFLAHEKGQKIFKDKTV